MLLDISSKFYYELDLISFYFVVFDSVASLRGQNIYGGRRRESGGGHFDKHTGMEWMTKKKWNFILTC